MIRQSVVPNELETAVENLGEIPMPAHISNYFRPLQYALRCVNWPPPPSDSEEEISENV